MKATAQKDGTVTVACTDFLGQEKTLAVKVSASDQGPNHILVANNGTAGANAWDKEVFCNLAVKMEAGKDYVIKARMKADQTGGCSLWPRWDASTNRDQWGNSADIQYLSSYNLTTQFQEFSWTMKADHPHDVIIFAIGKMGGNTYIDDLSCQEQGGSQEMIANGTFDSDDLANWSVLSWTGQKMSVQEDATTAIGRIVNRESSDCPVFDLQGRRVNSQPAKGLYIIGGKKTVVR